MLLFRTQVVDLDWDDWNSPNTKVADNVAIDSVPGYNFMAVVSTTSSGWTGLVYAPSQMSASNMDLYAPLSGKPATRPSRFQASMLVVYKKVV